MPLFRDLFDADRDAPLEAWDFSERLASLLYARERERLDFASWPEAPRVFYACYDLNFQVGNGGFAQAALNIPHLFGLAAQGYEILGLTEYASIIRKASQLLPAEHRAHLSKGLLGPPTLGAVFAHFQESDMSSFDYVTSHKAWWLGDNLNDYARRHAAEFLVLDSQA